MDEDLTGRTGDFIAGLAMFRDASAPAPSSELAAMFAATATTASAPSTPRRAPVYKRIIAGIPAKVAAGALGALLAGSVGAGALTGTMVLTSSHEDEAPAVETTTTTVADVPTTVVADPPADDEDGDGAAVEHEAPEVEDPVAVDEVDEGSANDAAAGADLAAVPAPTTVSEAAHTHDFDEACGNHGHYVSFFAQHGTEPDCAVQARSAGAPAAAGGDQVSTDDSTAGDQVVVADAPTDVSTQSVKSHGKAHTMGGNWQSASVKGSSKGKGDKDNKSKGGR